MPVTQPSEIMDEMMTEASQIGSNEMFERASPSSKATVKGPQNAIVEYIAFVEESKDITKYALISETKFTLLDGSSTESKATTMTESVGDIISTESTNSSEVSGMTKMQKVLLKPLRLLKNLI